MRQLMMTFALFIMGCALHLHPYENYLNESVGHADHDVIAKKMGAPHRIVALDKGGDVWTYDYCQPGAQATASPACAKINLIFDKSGKLAEWHDM
jgi:hypothetical protein